jgi:hypothetical protein
MGQAKVCDAFRNAFLEGHKSFRTENEFASATAALRSRHIANGMNNSTNNLGNGQSTGSPMNLNTPGAASIGSLGSLQRRKKYESALMKQKPWVDFVNAKDGLGNTASHIAVMHKQTHMVDWLMENKARRSMRLMNNQGLTPFTLSVWLGDVDMYTHIAQRYLGEVVWKYGPSCQLQFLDLEQIDSFVTKREPEKESSKKENQEARRPSDATVSSTGASPVENDYDYDHPPLHSEDGWRSAFHIIVDRECKAFANERIFNFLVESKWADFGRWIYFGTIFVTYSSVLAVYVSATYLRIQDLLKIRQDFPAIRNLSDHLPQGYDAFEDVSGNMFIILASVGASFLLYICLVLVRRPSRDLLQDHQARNYLEAARMFFFKNLASLLCAVMVGVLEGIVAARYQGRHDMVSEGFLCVCIVLLYLCTYCVHVYMYTYVEYVCCCEVSGPP